MSGCKINDQMPNKTTVQKEGWPGQPKLLLVGEYQPLLDGLAGWFAAEKRPWLSRNVAGLQQAFEIVRTAPPDVVIIDAGFADFQAITMAKSMLALRPQMSIILLSSRVTPIYREDAKQAGVNAYLMKHRMFEELLPILKGLLKT